jgi:hypothetical protein
MTTRTIKTREIIEDIRSGMGDVPIMEKYELSPTEFLHILDRLERVSAVDATHTQTRRRALQSQPTTNSGKRSLPRSYALFSIRIHDADNLGVVGTINDITQKGLQVSGIPASIGDLKTLVVRSDIFTVNPPLVMKATCRWVKKMPGDTNYVAGFEITRISKDDSRALRNLIQELTITASDS